MKTSLSLALLILSVGAYAQKAPAAAQPKPGSVEAFLLKAKENDQKIVTVEGKVLKFEERTSRMGNKYTVFDFGSPKSSLRVYIRATLAPKPKVGDMVKVTGKYALETRMGSSVFKNEIDATPAFKGKSPHQVTILPKTKCVMKITSLAAKAGADMSGQGPKKK